MAEMLREPAFPDERIRFRQEEIKASIRRQNDNPRMAAAREFAGLLFGDHPYGRSPRWDRIERDHRRRPPRLSRALLRSRQPLHRGGGRHHPRGGGRRR